MQHQYFKNLASSTKSHKKQQIAINSQREKQKAPNNNIVLALNSNLISHIIVSMNGKTIQALYKLVIQCLKNQNFLVNYLPNYKTNNLAKRQLQKQDMRNVLFELIPSHNIRIIELKPSQEYWIIKKLVKNETQNAIIQMQLKDISWTITLQQTKNQHIQLTDYDWQISRKRIKLNNNKQTNIQTCSQKIGAKRNSCFLIQANKRLQSYVEFLKNTQVFLNQAQTLQLYKQLSIQIPKTYLQLLKIQTLVVNTKKSSIYYTQHMVKIGIMTHELIICFKVILYDCQQSISKFSASKLRTYLSSLQEKYEQIKVRIKTFREHSIETFQQYYKSKSCQGIVSRQQIKEMLSFFQNLRISCLIFVQKVNKGLIQQISAIQQAIINEIKD